MLSPDFVVDFTKRIQPMIDKIEPYFNGGLLLELKGGEKIEVSRRQTVKFKEMMSL